jgi:flagellar basal-body rod protein FlgB
VEPVSSSLLLKALDGLSARAVATAQNIANAGTANYRPVEVSFERALASAAGQGADAVAAVQPKLGRAAGGAGMRLDLELATASSTATRYSALVEILGRQIEIEGLSITGTK